jgi:SAM-dependent methyltransferase
MACQQCGCRFERRGRLFRFLSPKRAADAEPFITQYRIVRAADGYRDRSPDDYRRLPEVSSDDSRRAEWRIRRESVEHLERHALGSRRLRLLDLGAGSGWLSNRLAVAGHHVVAVDRLDDEADGLGACQHYDAPFAAVHADFDALPFEPAQFDLTIFDGSLHYSDDPAATLAEARRMLVPGGAIAIMDSPMFDDEAAGRAMIASQLRRFAANPGVERPLQGGVGYFTYRRLTEMTASLGLAGRFVCSRGPISWQLRRQIGRMRLGRAPAAFGVWIAR